MISVRHKKGQSAFLSVVLLLNFIFLSGCSKAEEPISKTGIYFDTVITITLYNSAYEEQLAHCFVMAEEYENLFSAQKEGSEIYTLNHSKGEAVTVSAETIALLQKGIYYSALSEGRFDLTVGSLSSLWDFSEESEHKIPSSGEISDALATVDYRSLVIDEASSTARLTNPSAAVDLGGIAKGYIADQMKAYLLSEGITSGLINLGGNVLAVGPKDGDVSTYSIAIQDPFSSSGEAIASVKITDQSVVTSGTYQRYFDVDGKRYHHILDLSTGYPSDNGLSSVTIIADESLLCDALSTTVFLMGLSDGLSYVESLDGVEAIFITEDGAIQTTSGMGKTIPFSVVE